MCFVSTFQHCCWQVSSTCKSQIFIFHESLITTSIRFGVNYPLGSLLSVIWAAPFRVKIWKRINIINIPNTYSRTDRTRRAHPVSCTTRDKYSEEQGPGLRKHWNGMWMCNISNILVVILLLWYYWNAAINLASQWIPESGRLIVHPSALTLHYFYISSIC